MKNLKYFYKSIYMVGFVLFCCVAAIAQMTSPRPRIPSSQVEKPSPQEPPVRYEPSAELKNLAEAQGIREVNIVPGEQSAVITFRARPSVSPIVEIGGSPPKQGLDDQLEFSARYDLSKAEVVPDNKALAQTAYKATLSGLDSGTRYYYIITVPPSDGFGTRQIQGRFTTIKYLTKVTVVFTEIEVTNDSDDGGNGELFFKFFANYPNGEIKSYGDGTGNHLSWNDNDPARRINEIIEISNAPDRLDVAVNGYDDDSVLGGGTGLETSDFEPLGSPFNKTDWEANVAKQTFNLRDYSGDYHREDFVLHSMSHAAGQGDLSFIVKGYFELRREKAAR